MRPRRAPGTVHPLHGRVPTKLARCPGDEHHRLSPFLARAIVDREVHTVARTAPARFRGKKFTLHTQEILSGLARTYPEARCALHYTTPFELLVACILSAQCTDKRVNIVTARLFPKYNTPEAFAALTPDQLAEEIKECGLYRNKSKSIVELSRILVDRYDGQVPRSRQELMQLPGVGRKTANVVLSNAFGVPAIAVDTHVFRVANRIGLADAKDVLRTEEQLMANIPRDLWSQAHHWLIHHGRNLCLARNPRCSACPIQPCCKMAQTQLAAGGDGAARVASAGE